MSADLRWAVDVDPETLTAFDADAYPLFADADLTAVCRYDRLRFPRNTSGRSASPTRSVRTGSASGTAAADAPWNCPARPI